MARDYARNRTSRRNARTGAITPRGGRRPSSQLGMSFNKRSPRAHSFLLLISGMLIGLIIAGVIYIKRAQHEPKPTLAQTQENTTQSKKTVKLKNKLSNKQNAHIQDSEKNVDADENENIDEEETAVLDTLSHEPKKKIAEPTQPQYEFYTMLPKDKIDDISSERDKPEPKVFSNNQYQLQIASMKQFEDADHLKAQLILQGYKASISKQIRHGSTRYRVIVGPFGSSKAAMTHQQTLKKNGISSILLPAPAPSNT
ncbi:MAG: SPOR domain-containing protein [Gammaproteobacteria bacterium]|nr:SPOR domain-containing protein [Gammaproteobacteria bacterium]